MSWFIKGLITFSTYVLLLIGILDNSILITAVGAYLAGSSTTKLLFEYLDFREGKGNIVQE